MAFKHIQRTARDVASSYLQPILKTSKTLSHLQDVFVRSQLEKAFESYVLDPDIRFEYPDNTEYYNQVFNYMILDFIDQNNFGYSAFNEAMQAIESKATEVNPNKYLAYPDTQFPKVMVLEFFNRVAMCPHDLFCKGDRDMMEDVFNIAWNYIEEVETLRPHEKGESHA